MSSSGIMPPQLVAVGSVSPIYTFGSDHILKRLPPASDHFSRQAFDIEVRAYKRLSNHGRIAVSRVIDEGLVLERGECLRQKIQSSEPRKIPLGTRLHWAQEAAEGLRYIHSKGIIHADIGCHNLVLDTSGHIRFIDFAGSGIDGEPALVCYEWCASRGGSTPTKETDIFAFGSILFEIESGHMPYHELRDTMDLFQLMRTAEQRFAARQYPDMENFLLREVITGCWNGSYSSISEVEEDLRNLTVPDDGHNLAA